MTNNITMVFIPFVTHDHCLDKIAGNKPTDPVASKTSLGGPEYYKQPLLYRLTVL